MDAPTFINVCLRDLHAGRRAEVDPLSQDELLAIPAPGANSIAFLFWHFLRTEDEVLHRQVAGTDPISVRDNWAERWSVESSAIGTGFSHEQVAAFRPDKGLARCRRPDAGGGRRAGRVPRRAPGRRVHHGGAPGHGRIEPGPRGPACDRGRRIARASLEQLQEVVR